MQQWRAIRHNVEKEQYTTFDESYTQNYFIVVFFNAPLQKACEFFLASWGRATLRQKDNESNLGCPSPFPIFGMVWILREKLSSLKWWKIFGVWISNWAPEFEFYLFPPKNNRTQEPLYKYYPSSFFSLWDWTIYWGKKY